MPFLIISGERYALENGETVLGGHGRRALHAESLAHLQPFAAIDCSRDAPTTIRALLGGSSPVTLNGVPLQPEPDVLQHLDRVEVPGLVVVYGEMRRPGRSARAGGDTQATALVPLTQVHGEPTGSTGGRLTRLSDQSVQPVPASGLTIGRDPASEIVIDAKEVSRKHVTIAPSLLGYTLTDHSYRGVWVNGFRVDGHCVLGQRDVIRVDEEDFRFEADVASFEPDMPPEADAATAAVESRDRAASPVLASIEVMSDGPLKGTSFRIARPTVQIGRGRYNDVRLADDTVSGRHASLVRRGKSWIIFDVRSRNGTFVEGQAVRDHRVLPSECELQFGKLKLLFRAAM